MSQQTGSEPEGEAQSLYEVHDADAPDDDAVGVSWVSLLLGSFSQIFYPFASLVIDPEGRRMEQLETDLQRANIRRGAQEYLAIVLGIGLFCGLGLSVLAGTVGFAIAESDTITFSAVPEYGTATSLLGACVAAVAGGMLGLLVALGAAFWYPSLPSRSRAKEIDQTLPSTIAFMYSLSDGGLDTLTIFREVAAAEDAYGAAAVEFRRITRRIDFFHQDFNTAVEQVADTTPSVELQKFLRELGSTLRTGGDMSAFLEQQKDKYFDERERAQEAELDLLDLFSEMYVVLSVSPLFFLIVFMVVIILGNNAQPLMIITTYVGIPIIGVLFVLVVSTLTADERTGIEIEAQANETGGGEETYFLETPVIDRQMERIDIGAVASKIKWHQRAYNIANSVKNWRRTFRQHPGWTIIVSLPIVAMIMYGLITSDAAATGTIGPGVPFLSIAEMQQNTFEQTIYWLIIPSFLILLPITVFYEWNAARERAVVQDLTDTLYQLANKNRASLPLFAAFKEVSESNSTLLSKEFGEIHTRFTYGNTLSAELRSLANKYQRPRLTRAVKIINRSQEASSNIANTLETAALMSDLREQMEKERKTRTLIQTAIIGMTFLTLTAVLLMMDVFFVERISETVEEGGGSSRFASVNPQFLSMLFFHGAVLQGITAGLVAGYMQSDSVLAGAKYAIGGVILATLIWGGGQVLI